MTGLHLDGDSLSRILSLITDRGIGYVTWGIFSSVLALL